jgi:hypothetical protein
LVLAVVGHDRIGDEGGGTDHLDRAEAGRSRDARRDGHLSGRSEAFRSRDARSHDLTNPRMRGGHYSDVTHRANRAA